MEPFGTMEPLSEKRTWNRQKTSVGVVSSAGLACTYPLKSTGRSYRKAWCARAASGTMKCVKHVGSGDGHGGRLWQNHMQYRQVEEPEA
jgi:hypothetical protein